MEQQHGIISRSIQFRAAIGLPGKGCYEWEELCSHKSSPKLALLMLKMPLMNQVSHDIHWQQQESGSETMLLR